MSGVLSPPTGSARLLAEELLYALYDDPAERRLIAFSDSRQDAAKLAGGLDAAHHVDAVRQLVVAVAEVEAFRGDFAIRIEAMPPVSPGGRRRLRSAPEVYGRRSLDRQPGTDVRLARQEPLLPPRGRSRLGDRAHRQRKQPHAPGCRTAPSGEGAGRVSAGCGRGCAGSARRRRSVGGDSVDPPLRSARR